MHITTEHRVFERIEGELPIRYALHENNKEIFSAITKNVSGGGLRTTLLKKLDPGTLLDIEISIYDGDMKLRFKGKVAGVWDEPMDKEKKELFEAGIQFIDPRLFYVGKIIDCLEKRNN